MKSKIVIGTKTLLICGLRLNLGNNYDLGHLADALKEEMENNRQLYDALYLTDFTILIIQFRSNCGYSREYVWANDLFSFLR